MSSNEIAVYDSIADVDENQWNNLVSQSETGSVFQRSEWLRAVEAGLDSTPKHVVAKRDGTVVGVLPNFEVQIEIPDGLSHLSRFAPLGVVSIRPGFGGPVTASTDESVLGALLDGVGVAADGSAAYHRLNLVDQTYLGHATFLEDRGYVPSVKSCRFVVDLNRPFEELTERMSKDRRYNLRKGDEQEYRIVDEEPDRTAIDEFYPKYARAMERVGTDPSPRRFFDQLVDRLGDRIKLFGLEVDGTSAGKHLYVLDDEQETIHHLFSAVGEEDFEYYPSELLHAHAIEWGGTNGYERYDFGETSTDFSDGLFKYKKQFGGDLFPVLSWEAGLSTSRWYLFRFGRWIYRNRVA